VQHHVQPLVSTSYEAGGSAVVEGLLEAASGLEDWAESCGLLEGELRSCRVVPLPVF
jgi:hypothetical protein